MNWDQINWPQDWTVPQIEEPPPPLLIVQSVEQLPLDEPPIIIPGLLRQGEIILIGGHAKSWKSWALLDMLYCVANGIPWMVFSPSKAGVLHIDLELANWDIRHRLSAIKDSYLQGNFDKVRIVAHRGKPLSLGDLARIPAELNELGFVLLSLDPSYRLLASENESDPGVITELMNRILELGFSLQVAVALLQHFSKGNQSDKEALDRFSGSGVWARHPDALVMFTQHEDENCFTVNFVLRSFPPIDPFVVKWEYPRFRLATELDPEKLKTNKGGRPRLNTAEQLASLVHLEESISFADFERRAKKLCGISQSTFARRLKEAKNQKLIYLSPLTNEYGLTPEYIQRNGSYK